MNKIHTAPSLSCQWLALLMALCIASAGAPSSTLTFYVAPGGDDSWSGALKSANRSKTDGPLATIEAALEKSRAARHQTPGAEVRFLLRGGTYTLERPLVFKPEDSDLTVEAYRGERPVITSEVALAGWRRSSADSNVWEIQPPAGWLFHEIFVNGARMGRARLPAAGFFHYTSHLDKKNPVHPELLKVHPEDIQESWARGGVELIAMRDWSQARNRIRAVDPASGTITLAGSAMSKYGSKTDDRYFIENTPQGLRPGLWCQDAETGLTTYWPEPGEDVLAEKITAPRLCDLARLEGAVNEPVRNIVFRRLVFAGADWRFDGGSDVSIQSALEVEGTVQARFAERCAVRDCLFTRLGGYAVDFGHGCRSNTVAGCEMFDLGAGGVKAGDNIFVTSLEEATAEPNLGNVITDNHIHHIGRVNMPAAGVLVLISAGNLIAHNEIDHLYQTAISVGWLRNYTNTNCRDNIIEFNHVHDVDNDGLFSDMGGVYTIGYQPGTIVRCNLIHDISKYSKGYGAWGLYTDDLSSSIVLESNIVYHCQSAAYNHHVGRNNVVCNNIFALDKESQVTRTTGQAHLSFTFTNNIIYFDSGTLFSGNWRSNDFVIDHNIYFDTRAGSSPPPLGVAANFDVWRSKGYDVHSVFVDPLFVAPQKGDFRLRRGSPAIALGFHPLDLRQAGVRKQYANPPLE
jgi:hypothetical protein